MQRSTFRDPADGEAWQKQLRDRYNFKGVPPGVDLDLGKAVVRRVSRHLAQQIILQYEWLGTLPMCTHYYGIFFGLHCAGVTCVGLGTGGANIYGHKEWKVGQKEFAYLTRGACVHWAPPGTNSKLVAWTCKLLAKESAAKLIIAYADTDAGEIGTIYQASGWTCVGKGSSTRQWIAPNGRIYDQKHPKNLATARGGTRAQWTLALRKDGWKEQQSNPKWRYVSVLDKKDKALLDRVARAGVEYPKRKPSTGGAQRETVS